MTRQPTTKQVIVGVLFALYALINFLWIIDTRGEVYSLAENVERNSRAHTALEVLNREDITAIQDAIFNGSAMQVSNRVPAGNRKGRE